jgi:hypothetical protein
MQTVSAVENRKYVIKVGTSLLKTFVALWENSKLSWPTRVALAQCVCEFLNLDEEDPGEDFSEVFLKLLQVPALSPPPTHCSFIHFLLTWVILRAAQDPSYQVRTYMSRAITVFFSLYPHQIQIFNDLSPQLLPISIYTHEHLASFI